ncbi:MAG: LacI family DNA-binding transcriptional regulator [Verrucomicrobiota bacterium]|nr:LacI family DNA-binding transcriptional regulator [Verrucomicrobiota bacterium]
MPSSPTALEVARLAGCSITTVSKVFNHYSDVSSQTRSRVLEAATSLGYKPSPALSALVRRRWAHGHKDAGVVMGLIWTLSAVPTAGYFKKMRDGIVTQANAHGYIVRDFSLIQYKDHRSLHRQLQRTGITALICLSVPDDFIFDIPFENYYHVFFFGHQNYPHLNQIRYDWMHAVDHAVRRAIAAGYRRIGFTTNSIMNAFEERILKASYYLNNSELTERLGEQPKPLVFDYLNQPYARKDFAHFPVSTWQDSLPARWVREERPDVIISSDTQTYHILKMAGYRFPRDVGMISLRIGDHVSDTPVSCVDHLPENQGRVAVDVVHHLVQTGQLGLLNFPIIQSVEGGWTEGTTLGRKKACGSLA